MDGTSMLSERENRKIIQSADILLVNPDNETAEFWRENLLDFGMTKVRIARSVLHALEIAHESRPSGIVVALPILAEAFALMGALSQDETSNLREVPILLVAKQPSRAALLAATHAGFDAVLTQPVLPRQIYRRIGSMIQRARLSARQREAVD
jgi:DNA-binding response OmpR family regulator